MSPARKTTALFALSALTLASVVHTQAQAQTRTIYIGMNGGVMEQSYTKYVFPAFERIHNAKVVVVPGTSSDILAKVQASNGAGTFSYSERRRKLVSSEFSIDCSSRLAV